MESCAEWLGQPIINWSKNGRLNYIDRTIIGNGTTASPYVAQNPGEYTNDSLHPNQKGAKLLAKSVYAELNNWL